MFTHRRVIDQPCPVSTDNSSHIRYDGYFYLNYPKDINISSNIRDTCPSMNKNKKSSKKTPSMKNVKISENEHKNLTSLKAKITIELKGKAVNYRQLTVALTELGTKHKKELVEIINENMSKGSGERNESNKNETSGAG